MVKFLVAQDNINLDGLVVGWAEVQEWGLLTDLDHILTVQREMGLLAINEPGDGNLRFRVVVAMGHVKSSYHVIHAKIFADFLLLLGHRGNAKQRVDLEFQVRWSDGDISWDHVKKLVDVYIRAHPEAKLKSLLSPV